MTFSPKIMFLLSSVTLTAALALCSAVVWIGMRTVSLNLEAARLEGDVRDAENKITYLSSVRSLLRDTAEERTQLLSIADGVDAVALVQLVEDVARQTRVQMSVDAVAPAGAHKKDPSLEGVRLSVQARGSFAANNTFIAAMQDFPVPSVIEYVRLELGDNEWHATLRVQLYAPKTQAELAEPAPTS